MLTTKPNRRQLMRRHRTRTLAGVVAPFIAAGALVLATPERAVAQVSFGFGVVIGHDQERRVPPQPSTGAWYRYRDNRQDQFAYSNGYADGYGKGRDDGRDWRTFDPMRHRYYRSADHRYDRHLGPRFEYERAYRDGFWSGYSAGFREAQEYRGNPRGRNPRRWPY
jgi:hypothetical protein